MTGKSLQLSKYGTAATADKQTSPTDTTAGALMAVEAFGLGQTSGPNLVANIDDETLASGKYQFTQGNQGTYPRHGSGVLEVSVYRVDSNPFTTQTITYNESDSGNKYYRSYNNSTTSWSPWKELYHTGNILGTVSQSGGVPTGAIIERGSDSNGEYVKFADGTMECWLNRTTSAGTSGVTRTLNWFFPEEFSSTPVCDVGFKAREQDIDASVNNAMGLREQSQTSPTKKFTYFYVAATTNLGVNFALRAIGRWY